MGNTAYVSEALVVVLLLITVAVQYTNCERMNGRWHDLSPPQEPEAKQRAGTILKLSQDSKNSFDENIKQFEPLMRYNYPFLFDSKFRHELTSVLDSESNQTNTSSTCQQDVINLLTDILQGKSYTFQVLDAVGKPSSGITQGSTAWLGSYDICTSVLEYTSNVSQDVKFQGKYCLAGFSGSLLGLISPLLELKGVDIGICLPNTCDSTAINSIVDKALDYILTKLNGTGNVSKDAVVATGIFCAESAEWTTGDTVAICLSSFILFLLVCGSIYDAIQRVLAMIEESHPRITLPTNHNVSDCSKADLTSNELPQPGSLHEPYIAIKSPSPRATACKALLHQFLMAFSAITNAEKLLNTQVHEGQLGAVNGIRVLSMSWVILGHTNIFMAMGLESGTGGFVNNVMALGDVLKRFTFQAICNATFSVDSFFFLSGLLVSYLLLRELKQTNGKLKWPILYFHRFWRLTPVYMFVLMMYTTIYRHLPTGPFMRGPDKGSDHCYKYWWANLLYINNFVPKDLQSECMGWSWYLANDMQFFIITPVIAYLLYRYRYVGYSVVSVLILTCLISTGIVARVNNVSATISALPRPEAANSIYVRNYHRIAPYLVGVVTGELLSRNKGGIKLPKIWVAVGWALAVAINMSVLYGVYGPNSTSIPWNADVNALYLATSRFAWSLGLAWVTFACVTGYGGPVNAFLSWRAWVPLGRLTYCAYLIHPIVIFNYLFSRRQLIYYNDYNMIYLYISHLVISYMVAFVVSIAVEAPMLGLEKLIFKKKKA